MFVIAGVTGKTGSVVADTLMRAGQPVRVIVRQAAQGAPFRARGAEVAVASLDDEAALTAALAGASGAYLLSPQDLRDPEPLATGQRLADTLARAIERAALPHAVVLSVMGAQLAEGTGICQTLHALETRLSTSPAALTFVRAAAFLDTWAMVLGPAAAGALPTFLTPDRAVPLVATRDVGLVAARALMEGPPRERRTIIELAGPRELSPQDLALTLGRLLGHPVTPAPAPLEAVLPAFTAFGASPAFAEQLRQLYQATNEGRLVFEGSGRTLRGTIEAEQFFAPLVAVAAGRSS